jgi:Uma2 family endonuclease
MTSAFQLPKHTVNDYFALEAAHEDTRYEYDGGIAYAMAGASEDHRTIATNIVLGLGPHIKKQSCHVWQGDTRVALTKGPVYYYPDVVVACGNRAYEIVNRMESLTNAALIVEIHSSSTESFDKTRKRAVYRQMPFVMDYLMVRQDIVNIIHDSRTDEGWATREYWDFTDEIALLALDCILKVADVYDQIEGLPAL